MIENMHLITDSDTSLQQNYRQCILVKITYLKCWTIQVQGNVVLCWCFLFTHRL